MATFTKRVPVIDPGDRGRTITPPTLSQSKASDVLEQQIPNAAWAGIEQAFAVYGDHLKALDSSKSSKSKGDDQGWQSRKESSIKALEASMAKIEATRSRHGNFMHEVSELHALSMGETCAGENPRRLLDDAYMALLKAVTIIERTDPDYIETPTEAHSRDILVRSIRDILRSNGLNTDLSTGFQLDMLGRTVLTKDLTKFEQLISAFLIGDDKMPAAFSAWLRAILSDGKKQG